MSVEGVGGGAGAGGVGGAGAPVGEGTGFGKMKGNTLDDLKNHLIEEYGEEEGTEKFENFQKMMMMGMVRQTQQAADRALAAQKKARQEQQ